MAALPALGGPDDFFWTSGRDGRLRFLRCERCGVFFHPPQPRCPFCLRADVAPEPVSGFGTVASFTFLADGDGGSTVIAWIDLADQDDLRMTAKLVGVTPAQVTIGMAVVAAFEPYGEVFLPVFAPVGP